MGGNSCRHFCSGPLQRLCQTGWFQSHKSWGRKMPKIPWPPKQLPLSTSRNWDHWCVWQVHYPFLSGLAKKLVDVSGDPREHHWPQGAPVDSADVTWTTASLPRQMLTTKLFIMHFARIGFRKLQVVWRSISLTYCINMNIERWNV